MASEATQNSYEQQREERIAQNRKKLADMGIVEAWKEAAQLRVPTKANIVKVKREAPVTRSHGLIRKSARLHPGLKREYEATVEEEKLSKRRAMAVPAKRLQELEEDDAEAIYRHNLMRLKSMSTPAMQRRIRAIKRLEKMESLILVLEDAHRDDLLKQAEEALKGLQ